MTKEQWGVQCGGNTGLDGERRVMGGEVMGVPGGQTCRALTLSEMRVTEGSVQRLVS